MIADPDMQLLSEVLGEGFPLPISEPTRGPAVVPVEADEFRDRELLNRLIFAQAQLLVDTLTRTPPDRQLDIGTLLNRFADATGGPARAFRARERERYLRRLHACTNMLS